jgi:hypothetical protein
MRIAALVLIAALGSTARVSLAPASTLEEVLERAGAYIGRFDAAVASLVAEEHYLQKYVIPDALPAGRVTRPYEEKRDIKSDFLMVRSQESDLWIPFRDVYEVDGKPVREREERLTRLLVDASGSTYDRARRLTEEGARYNIGPVRRTVSGDRCSARQVTSASTASPRGRFSSRKSDCRRSSGRPAVRACPPRARSGSIRYRAWSCER